MKRPQGKERQEYEEKTKEIRFDLYKEIIKDYPDTAGVILGHHLGDLQENIIFNFMKGRGLLQLPVIMPISKQYQVKVLRPLLGHPKTDIFKLSEVANIPYFKNTTPVWSNRGRFRNEILPLLQTTFGIGFGKNIIKNGEESDELKLLIHEEVIKPYLQTVFSNEGKHYFPKLEGKTFTFWKIVISHWASEQKLPPFSFKSLTLLYEQMKMSGLTVTMNSKCTVAVTDNYIIFSV
jgi:tRNA(Ile)-lysidine synthase TilS/MesJ